MFLSYRNISQIKLADLHSSSLSRDCAPPPNRPLKKPLLGASGVSTGVKSSPSISFKSKINYTVKDPGKQKCNYQGHHCKCHGVVTLPEHSSTIHKAIPSGQSRNTLAHSNSRVPRPDPLRRICCFPLPPILC